MSDLIMQRDHSMGSVLYTPENSGPVELLPNPDFVFPPRSPDQVVSSLSGWASLNQQRRSDQQNLLAPSPPFSTHTRQGSSSLPDFVFNPAAASSNASPLSTPPQSPQFPGPLTPSRSRHRRGGSEFIGRDRGGAVNIVSSSPEKIDLSSQRPLHLGPPPGRRHAHRRSGAVSLQDLTSVLQPRDPNSQRSGSAPTTPLEPEKLPIFAMEQVLASGQPEITDQNNDSPQKRPPSRARVGFADRVEYIRPLSIISSETESSMSTIRGHSVTGSFSSVVSGTPSVRMARPSLDTVTDADAERPQTSQVAYPSPRRASLPDVGTTDRPRSSSCASDSSVAPTRPKKRGFHWWDSKNKSTHTDSQKRGDRLDDSPPRSPIARNSLESDQETVRDAHLGRKPRKVRSWAHSLISRKAKSKKDRVPTPKLSKDSLTSESESGQSQNNSELDFEPNFDEDNTVTIITETSHAVQKPALDMSMIKPELSPDPDVLSPVIDLDAALGPFNTPPLASNARGSRMPPRARRSMHSLVGSQVHRRTESAPELVPFDPRNLKMMPASQMPDVFEEDDEELVEEPETPREASVATESSNEVEKDQEPEFEDGMGVHVVEMDEGSPQSNPFRRSITGFGSTRRKKSEGLSISIDSPVLAQEPRPRERFSIEVVHSPEDQRRSKASDETLTPPQSACNDNLGPHYSIPLQPHHIMTPDTLSDSCGSPFFNASQVSFDTPRLGTGTSSMTDCHQAFASGESGPEVRISVDDVPSLTSSRSTMTSPMVIPPGPSNLSYVHAASDMLPPPPKTSGSELDGSAPSVYSIRSTTAVEFNRKRSSIASLSRLIVAPFGGDRTRAFHSSESPRPHSQHLNASMASLTGKSDSGKTRKRISKLVQFWKGGKDNKENRPATSSLAMSMSR